MVKRKSSLDHLQPGKIEEFSDSVASFFRIIMPPALIENKLVLPKKFCKKYGDELSKVVRLIVPAGGSWKVGLEKFGDVLLLCDGWQKFMDHYSILSGHFLTFNYRGNSEFNVNVFDLTATEIQYPSSGNSEMPWYNNNGMVSQEEEFYDGSEVAEEEDDDDCDDASTAILASTFASTRFRSSNSDASTEHLNQVRKRRTRGVSPINLSYQSSHNTEELGLESSKDLNQETCSKRHKSSSGDYSRRQTSMVQERERALNAAKLYKSVNPLFIVPLSTYNVQRSYLLHVPAKFSRVCMQPCPKVIELQDSDNEKWPVHCLIGGGKVIALSKGWSAFVKKEKLNAGDVCVFESIQTNGAMLKVTVFRATKC